MKSNILKRITILATFTFAFILINGCAVSGLSTEPMRFHKDYAENGLVIGSITFTNEKARSNSYFTYFHSLDSVKKISRENSRELQISPDQTWKVRHSGELNNGKTYLFAFERVPGKYEVSKVRLATVGMGGAVRDNQIANFSIPFEVKKGEITYVGEINLNEYALKDEKLISLNDNYERDIQAIKLKQPIVKWDLTKKSELKIIYK